MRDIEGRGVRLLWYSSAVLHFGAHPCCPSGPVWCRDPRAQQVRLRCTTICKPEAESRAQQPHVPGMRLQRAPHTPSQSHCTAFVPFDHKVNPQMLKSLEKKKTKQLFVNCKSLSKSFSSPEGHPGWTSGEGGSVFVCGGDCLRQKQY